MEKYLEAIGLSDKESKVYLAVLELGESSVVTIARKSLLKRPTVYIVLDSLLRRGLVRRVPKNSKSFFIAENPEALNEMLATQQKSIERVLPLIRAFYNSRTKKPSIKYYEGSDGVKKIYAQICQAKKSVYFYGSIKDILSNYEEVMLTPEKAVQMKISIKEIMSTNPVDKSYAARINKTKNNKHEVRLVDENDLFAIDMAIIDDRSLALIYPKADEFGLLIESIEITKSLRTLFEMAWQAATPVA